MEERDVLQARQLQSWKIVSSQRLDMPMGRRASRTCARGDVSGWSMPFLIWSSVRLPILFASSRLLPIRRERECLTEVDTVGIPYRLQEFSVGLVRIVPWNRETGQIHSPQCDGIYCNIL